MSRIDPTKMSYKDLVALKRRLDAAICVKRADQAQEVKAKLAALAQKSGFNLSELIDGGKRPAKRKSAVKYRNPKDPSQTWTGRGRRPLWLADAVGKGTKLDSFAV